MGSKFSSNASKQQEIVETNSRESTNVGERILKDSRKNESGEKESIEYMKSSNSDITTQKEKTVDEVIDETKGKVQTQTPRTNKNIIETIKNGEAKEALKKATKYNTLDDVAVRDKNVVYLLDTSYEGNRYDYGAYQKITFENENIAKKIKEEINNDIRTREKNRQSNTNVENKDNRLGNNSDVGENVQNDRSITRNTGEQSSNINSGVYGEDGDNGRG